MPNRRRRIRLRRHCASSSNGRRPCISKAPCGRRTRMRRHSAIAAQTLWRAASARGHCSAIAAAEPGRRTVQRGDRGIRKCRRRTQQSRQSAAEVEASGGRACESRRGALEGKKRSLAFRGRHQAFLRHRGADFKARPRRFDRYRHRSPCRRASNAGRGGAALHARLALAG